MEHRFENKLDFLYPVVSDMTSERGYVECAFHPYTFSRTDLFLPFVAVMMVL